MRPSKFLSLNTRDFMRSLVMAMGTPVVEYLLMILSTNSFTVDWKRAGILAASAALTYLGKNFFTPTKQNDK